MADVAVAGQPPLGTFQVHRPSSVNPADQRGAIAKGDVQRRCWLADQVADQMRGRHLQIHLRAGLGPQQDAIVGVQGGAVAQRDRNRDTSHAAHLQRIAVGGGDPGTVQQEAAADQAAFHTHPHAVSWMPEP